jgi:ParB/RepB/Spo0J family partition protein
MKYMEILKKDIEPSPWNPRGDGEGLKELNDSIKGMGLIEPVVVRPNQKKKGKYLISAGEQRWKSFEPNQKVPCVIREGDDETDAKIVSLVENYIRKNVEDYKNEAFIAKLYHEGVDSGKWVASEKHGKHMSDVTGIPRQFISDCVTAHQERNEMKLSDHATSQISTADMKESRSLKDKPDLRKQLLEKRAEAKETERGEDQPALKKSGHVVHEKSKILSKLPDEVAKSVLDEKIDWDQAETVATTIEQEGKELSKKEELQLVKHLEQEKRMLDIDRDLSKRTSEQTVKGKPEKHFIVDKTVDQQRLERFTKLSESFKYMTKADIEIIDDEKLQQKAIECIKIIRDNCSRILRDLEVESIIDVKKK